MKETKLVDELGVLNDKFMPINNLLLEQSFVFVNVVILNDSRELS